MKRRNGGRRRGLALNLFDIRRVRQAAQFAHEDYMAELKLDGIPEEVAGRIVKESAENDLIYAQRGMAGLDWSSLHYGHAHMLRWALRQLGDVAGGRVLDVGTGDGFSAVLLAQAGAQVSAIDVSEAALQRAQAFARSNRQDVEFRRMAGECLDYGDGHFDAILCISAFHHMDLTRACREFHRVLRPGGRLALVEPLYTNPPAWLYRKLIQWNSREATSHERPLRLGDVKLMQPWFQITNLRGMFLLTLPLTCLDRLTGKNPWVVRCTSAIFRALAGVDEAVASTPPLNRLAWKIAIAASRRT